MTQTHTQQAIAAALAHHQAGRLEQAERGYAAVLALEPRNVDALHLMGALAQQTGRNEVAIENISKAIALSTNSAVKAMLKYNLASAQRSAGKLQDAVTTLQSAVTL